MTTQSLICGLGNPSWLPDELPDNDRAGSCTGPDSHGPTASVNGRHQPGRAGFGTKRSQVQILSPRQTFGLVNRSLELRAKQLASI